MSRRGPPNLPPEEPSIPLDPGVASARAKYIKDTVAKIYQMRQHNKTGFEIREQHTRFADDYPSLFKKVMTVPENNPELRMMLVMLEKMGKSELTQDQASVIVGQKLADKYIQPALDVENASKKS